MSAFQLALQLFLQLAVILAACRAIGWIGARFGQTQVVCEMVAGVLLGPSLLGVIAPSVQATLFPAPSMPILYILAQLGLVLYMFMIGLEFDPSLLAGRARGAVLVSGAGIVAPLALGAAAAVLLRDDASLFAPQVTPAGGALYLGAAMSITAFPMLARILHEKGIAQTRMGTLALAAGASDDALAWCLLAIVLAQLESSVGIAVAAIGGGVVYAVTMLTIGRRALAWLGRRVDADGVLTPTTLALTLIVLMLGAWATDVIGIYAVFGAFVAGIAMPRGRFVEETTAALDLVVTTLLLPVFFVYSGLNTRIGLLDSWHLWGITALVLAIAVGAKGGACTLAARATGEPWRDALTIGVLMNARGLMELIILNIGLERGVITPTLFTIMVLMAIVTTLMASPLFERVARPRIEITG